MPTDWDALNAELKAAGQAAYASGKAAKQAILQAEIDKQRAEVDAENDGETAQLEAQLAQFQADDVVEDASYESQIATLQTENASQQQTIAQLQARIEELEDQPTSKPLPKVSVRDAVQAEETSGAITFTVVLDGEYDHPVKVPFKTVDGTAVGGQDYIPIPNGEVTFAPGETEKPVLVMLINDNLVEPAESFSIKIEDAKVSLVITDDTGAGSITSEDQPPPLPTISIDDVSVQETAGSTNFAVKLSAAATEVITVKASTRNGTATGGQDFTAKIGETITFQPGEVLKQFNVLIINDTAVENGETFFADLTDGKTASGAVVTIADASATGNITSEDVDPPTGLVEPTAATSGIPAGTVLTTYTGPMAVGNGTVIERKIINGQLDLLGSNGVIRHCRFPGTGNWSINGDDSRATGWLVEQNDFTGGLKAMLFRGKAYRNKFSGMCIALTSKGGPGTHLYRNHVSNLSAPAGSHFDGFFVAGDEVDILMEENSITVPAQGGTADIFVATRWPGADIIRPVTKNNWLRGTPSFAIYYEDIDVANIVGGSIIGNKIQKGPNNAYWFITNRSTVLRQGNTDINTGANIDNT